VINHFHEHVTLPLDGRRLAVQIRRADGVGFGNAWKPCRELFCGQNVIAATWRSARNISSDFRVAQSTNIEALLLVGTHDLQTLSDHFDCPELLDYCKTRGT
jgi:hypothetical protein